MSIRSITDLAVSRDETPKGKEVGSKSPARKNERQTDTLISAVPTEVLVLYTAVTSGVLAEIIRGNADSYLPFRWAVLGIAIAITPIAVWTAYRTKYQARRSRPGLAAVVLPPRGKGEGAGRDPILEMSASTIAAAAWFLAAPGSPLFSGMSTNAAALASVSIVVGATAVLWAGFSRPLKIGSIVKPQVPPAPNNLPAVPPAVAAQAVGP
jgi:hypothetical protein